MFNVSKFFLVLACLEALANIIVLTMLDVFVIQAENHGWGCYVLPI